MPRCIPPRRDARLQVSRNTCETCRFRMFFQNAACKHSRRTYVQKLQRRVGISSLHVTEEEHFRGRLLLLTTEHTIPRPGIRLRGVRVTAIFHGERERERDSQTIASGHFSRVTSKGIKAETTSKARDGRKSSIRRPLESIGIIRLAPPVRGGGREGGWRGGKAIPRGRRDGPPSKEPGVLGVLRYRLRA